MAPLISANQSCAALSSRLLALPPSGTLAVGETVRAVRARGQAVFNLSGGAPDPGPPIGFESARISPEENSLGEPYGELALRTAFAARLAASHDVIRSGHREMVVTIGAKQAVYFSFLALSEPGDDIVIIDPCWGTYAPSAALAGARAVPVPLGRDNALDVAAIAAALTPKTRAILINTPHNPTGRVFNEAELTALARLVKEKDLWLICDESFDLFVFDGRRHLSPGIFDTIRDRTVLLYSFSKAFALPGARIGMLVGPEPLCRLIANCTQQLISSVALPSQKLAFAALQQEAEWAPFLRKTYQEKRDMCLKGLAADKRLETTVSEGTFYLFPNIERIGMTSDELAKHLLNCAGVAVTPGTVFGVAGAGHIRINMVGPNAHLDAGVTALIQGLPQ